MPELPEVETVKRVLEPIVKDRKIVKIDVLRMSIVNNQAEPFISYFENEQFLSISRIGKFLIFHLTNDKVLISHLRMEGKYIELSEDEDNTKYAHTVFNDDLTGRDIIEIIRPHLTKENLYELGPIEKYEVDCTNLNINEKKLIVGKITNTDDIVFCYPSKRVLMELEKEEDYEPKVNQLSTMTKFKNKYNI